MSEAAKSRFAIDLDEIERQIREATYSQAERSRPVEDDPLAELARIVGHEAPRAQAAPPRPSPATRPQAAEPAATPAEITREFDDIFGAQQQPSAAADRRYAEPQAAPAYADPQPYAGRSEPAVPGFDSMVRTAAGQPVPPTPSFQDEWTIRAGENARDGVPVDLEALSAEMAATQAHDADWRASSPAYGAEHYNPYAPVDDDGYANDPGYVAPAPSPEPRNRLKTALIAVGALVGVGVAGVGAAVILRGPGGSQGNGGPPLIEASNAPLKVAPINPGGVEIPDQNKQILDRPDPNSPAAQANAAKVVSNEEQPLDVNQATRQSVRNVLSSPQAAPGATAAISAPAAMPSPNAALGEPRRVKTVSIKPPEPPPSVTAGIPTEAPAPRAMQLPTDAAQPSQTASAAQVKAQDRQRTAARRTGTDSDATAPQEGASPLSISPGPAPTPKPRPAAPAQRTASLQPQAQMPATESVAAAQPAANGGGWAVQLASETSEEGARAAMSRLKSRYSELANLSPTFRRAEVNGTTRYRVRVGGMSREEADQLCTALKGKGGACVLTRN